MINLPISNYIGEQSEARRNSTFQTYQEQSLKYPKLKKKRQNQTVTNKTKQEMFKNVFKIDPEIDTKFLQFSQRRFAGFRSKIEFDKKRLILSNKNTF